MALRRERKIRITVKLSFRLYRQILDDLRRQHAHAAERVGFCFSKMQQISEQEYLILMYDYETVNDSHYVNDRSVGAHINSDAILRVMQHVIDEKCGAFHTHMHWGLGIPNFSTTDIKSLPKVVKSFRLGSMQAHGMFLLNDDSLNCLAWLPGIDDPVTVDKIVLVGYPSLSFYPNIGRFPEAANQFERQSFLGPHSHWYLSNLKVGIVGLGGGGSHIMQQLAHLGVGNYVLCDPDIVEETNLNRMVGSTVKDVRTKMPKVKIAERLIRSVLPSANVKAREDVWENCTLDLHSCDIVVGCLDTVSGRRDLEAECRRYLIPLVDIGMDVYENGDRFDIRGQVILSMPGEPCFLCYDFVNEDSLKKEAERYGAAGGRPQVVWSNGVLASSAVGIIVEIATGWTKISKRNVYLSYNGNLNTVRPHVRGEHPLNNSCPHFSLSEIGPPIWTSLKKLRK